MLTHEQIDAYRERGYVLAEGAVPKDALARMRRIVDAIVARASEVTQNNEIYDLEESHRPDHPRVRRIKEPVDRDPFFWELVRSPGVIEPVTQLIGPDLRLHGSKLNMKSATYGAPVEWHQDWAFYPHSNDDVLAVGIMIDDVLPANGPLMVMPGSHRGPVLDHRNNGYFVGAADPVAAGLDIKDAAVLTGPAGSMTIHHVRALHGSALNTSPHPRRMLFYEIAAADAWPLLTFLDNYRDFAHFNERMITGAPTLTPRMRDVPVRIPGQLEREPDSIYNLQLGSQKRYFAGYAETMAP
jgi:ectoine hydroxylase-related dioxygenase (phytanoyl-CoA dioxygenase family)